MGNAMGVASVPCGFLLMVQKSSKTHQLRKGSDYPTTYRVVNTIPGGWEWDF